jgi:hypothetical protein
MAVHFVIGTQKQRGNLVDISFSCQAPEDWRTPRRFAYFRNHRVARSVVDCGGPPPLFPETYPTVPMLTGTALMFLAGGVDAMDVHRTALNDV